LTGTGLQYMSQNDFVHIAGLDAGTFQGGLDGDFPQIASRNGTQSTIESTDWGAGGANDYNFITHGGITPEIYL
jgi:hypothetical protein